MRQKTPIVPLVLLAVGALAATAAADVALVTIPRREQTQLTIYNSEDITMVREHRLLTVKKGINRIQFAWANTLIDPTSIDFRILDRPDQADLIDTTFPAGRTDALQWNIDSKIDGKIAVEIRYFTSGITWTADYVGIANQAETEADLTGYVRVYNNSGEDYENAQVRLVVGTINLVEKIKELAERTAPGKWRELEERARGQVREQFAKAAARAAPSGPPQPTLTPGHRAAPEIVKEGLSEYFLFTIEGRETIPHGQPKRLVCMDVEDVPLDVIYKLSDRKNGQKFTKYYRFKNIKLTDEQGNEKDLPGMANLGVSPLPDGNVRLFSEYANKDLAYVGGTQTRYVPIGDRVEVALGFDPDITLTRKLMDQRVTHIVAREHKRMVGKPRWVDTDRGRQYLALYEYYTLIDYDETFYYETEVVSGKAGPVKVDVERRFDANVILWPPGAKPDDWDEDKAGAYVDLHDVESRVERVDQNHVKYFLDLLPGKRHVVTYRVTYKRRGVGPELHVHRQDEPYKEPAP